MMSQCMCLIVPQPSTANMPPKHFTDARLSPNTERGRVCRAPSSMRPSFMLYFPHHLSQVLVLDFWTLCCINCMHVLPELAALESKYQGLPVAVVGVHSAKFDNEKDRCGRKRLREETCGVGKGCQTVKNRNGLSRVQDAPVAIMITRRNTLTSAGRGMIAYIMTCKAYGSSSSNDVTLQAVLSSIPSRAAA